MITLYHGSNIEVSAPLAKAGRNNLDFGRGFYLTTIRKQASDWANIIAMRKERSARGVALTEKGLALKRRADDLVDLAERVEEEIKSTQSNELVGTVSIGADQAELTVLYGELDLQNLSLPFGEFSGIGKLCAGETRLFQQKK